MKFQFRVTKYDPRFRDSRGAYTRHDWTSMSQIGQSFEGEALTASEYERVEAAYVSTAVAMLAEAGVEFLTITGIERDNEVEEALNEGTVVPLSGIADVARSVLREHYWCRLESPHAFVHFGHDYYMYVGVPELPARALAEAPRRGIFIEECKSPYALDGGSI